MELEIDGVLVVLIDLGWVCIDMGVWMWIIVWLMLLMVF